MEDKEYLDTFRYELHELLKGNNFKEIVRQYHLKHPFFYDRARIFWFWNPNQFKYEMVDETDLLVWIDKAFDLNGSVVAGSVKNSYLESFRQVGRENTPKEIPASWVQFKNRIYDVKTMQQYDASPEWFVTNPIPWNAAQTDETPIIDKLFTEWVGEEHKQFLYELFAYCCLPDYPIHGAFVFIGVGRNGKSKCIGLMRKFLGGGNWTSSDLKLLSNNVFEASGLYKKLVCFMGETDYGILKETDKIKKLTGQDPISMQFKHKDKADMINYAKLVIATNGLPISDDVSDAWYRRWFIIDFPNKFEEGKEILDIIPEAEFEALALKCIKILPILLEKGKFTNQGTIEDRKAKYLRASNPLTEFIDTFYIRDFGGSIRYGEFYNYYQRYLTLINKRPISKKEFSRLLAEEMLEVKKVHNSEFEGEFVVQGVRKREFLLDFENKGNVTDVTDFLCFHINTYVKNQYRTTVTSVTSVTDSKSMKELIVDYLKDKKGFAEITEIVKDLKVSDLSFIGVVEELKNEQVVFENPAGVLRLLI